MFQLFALTTLEFDPPSVWREMDYKLCSTLRETLTGVSCWKLWCVCVRASSSQCHAGCPGPLVVDRVTLCTVCGSGVSFCANDLQRLSARGARYDATLVVALSDRVVDPLFLAPNLRHEMSQHVSSLIEMVLPLETSSCCFLSFKPCAA